MHAREEFLFWTPQENTQFGVVRICKICSDHDPECQHICLMKAHLVSSEDIARFCRDARRLPFIGRAKAYTTRMAVGSDQQPDGATPVIDCTLVSGIIGGVPATDEEVRQSGPPR